MTRITIPVAPGELLDRLTILEIKSERIAEPGKRDNVQHERSLLEEAWRAAPQAAIDLGDARARLRAVNERLWEIEDAIRACEAEADFGERFVELARSVYRNNDERAAIKREIDERTGSEIVEEKSYPGYRR